MPLLKVKVSSIYKSKLYNYENILKCNNIKINKNAASYYNKRLKIIKRCDNCNSNMFPIKPISDRTLYGAFNLQSVPG